MKNTQTNIVRMFNAAHRTCLNNVSIWSANPGMRRTVTKLGNIIGEIEKASMTQYHVTTGLVRLRLHKERQVVAAALDFCAAFHACGTDMGNEHLVAISETSESGFVRMRKPDLVDALLGLCKEAQPFLTELAEYGFGETEVNEFLDQVTDYGNSVHALRVAMGERVAATSRLKELLREGSQLLRSQLDKQMKRYRDSHFSFTAAYETVRKIVHHGIRHTSEEAPAIAPVESNTNDESEVFPPLFTIAHEAEQDQFSLLTHYLSDLPSHTEVPNSEIPLLL